MSPRGRDDQSGRVDDAVDRRKRPSGAPVHHREPFSAPPAIVRVRELQKAHETQQLATRRLWESLVPLALSLALLPGSAGLDGSYDLLVRCLVGFVLFSFLQVVACVHVWHGLWCVPPTRVDSLRPRIARARVALTLVVVAHVGALVGAVAVGIATALGAIWPSVALSVLVALVAASRLRAVIPDLRRLRID